MINPLGWLLQFTGQSASSFPVFSFFFVLPSNLLNIIPHCPGYCPLISWHFHWFIHRPPDNPTTTPLLQSPAAVGKTGLSLMCSFLFCLNPRTYESMILNCAYRCTVYVNSVPKCTVNYIFLFFFKKKEKKIYRNVMVVFNRLNRGLWEGRKNIVFALCFRDIPFEQLNSV